MKAHFNGDTLVLPAWHFSQRQPRVPHRSRGMAWSRVGRRQYFVSCNHKRTLFWVRAMGPGFAGECSRHSMTCTTRKKDLAEKWIAAVAAGKVRVSGDL